MDADNFIEYIKKHIRDSSVQETISILEKPPGRRPPQKIKELSSWFHAMTAEDKEKLKEVITEAIDSSLFGFLCALDGVRAIEDSENKGRLELYYNKYNEKTLINKEDGEYLHDKYKGLIQD
jgi:hypothetical protein